MLLDVLADGLGFTEGPVWLPDNRVALTSISHGCVYIVDPDEGSLERIDTGGGPNGLACSTDGTLYVAQNGGVWGASGPAEPGVQVITGTQVDYLVEGLGAPNDLTFGPDGRLWITDTRSEFDTGTPGAGLPGHVYATDVASGETDRVIDDGPVFINGLGFDRDGSRLLVTATLSSQLLSYNVFQSGYQGPGSPEVVHTFDDGWPDGMAVSSEGHYWVALTAADRIDVVDTWGRLVVEI
ncbi:MAG: SMP-30/gluconolactonase/LRE family protein, partial [Mycobacterium sp.]